MNRQPTLDGELVAVRPLRADDFDWLYAAAADPLLWEQHPDKERWRDEVFRAYFDDHLASGGALAVIERKSGDLIGATRYANYDSDASEIEIGWTFLARPYWGGLYNAELKRVMLDHAFQSVKTWCSSWTRATCDPAARSRSSAQPSLANAEEWCSTPSTDKSGSHPLLASLRNTAAIHFPALTG